MLALWLVGACAAGEAPDAGLVFSLDTNVRWLSPTLVEVPYSLKNAGRRSAHVVQVPGPSLVPTCVTATGVIGGSPLGGWSDDDGGLRARELFVQLAPGEAVRGRHVVVVPPECSADLEILGAFQAARGFVNDRPSVTGRFQAAPLPLALPPNRRSARWHRRRGEATLQGG